ncbi:MAG TPA: RHS repeat-associated core domain-containing protein [Steroidobacteraceae bacterium]
MPRLLSVSRAGGGSVATTYDSNANVASKADFNGNKTCYAYDTSRNLETVRLEGLASGLSCPSNLASYTPTSGTRQRKTSTQWHSTYRLPTQIDEPGKRTTFTHDTSGNVLTKTVLDTTTSESRTWTYTYNSFGQVLTANGPRTDVSDVTAYTYYSCTTGYECGQLHTVTNALGHVTTYNTYNAHGQPLTITDPNGLVTTLTYDLRQRLTSRTVGSEQTTFTYWPTGLLKKTTLPDGSFLEYTYDGAHRLTEIEDSEGNRIVYTLDNMGNRTAENFYDPSNALTQTRTRVFNTLNQLWKEIGAAGTSAVTTTFSYDDNGNQTGIAAPLSRNTSQDCDELNRLTQVTDPLSGVTQYGYNALDQLISVTDPRSKVTSNSYNALGDLTQHVSPDTGTTTNTYDSGGNVATSTDARSKTGTYAYDALNRVTSLTYSDQTISYTYDGGTNQKGRLTQVSDASGSTSWTYDTHGRVLSRQQSMGVTKTVSYAYDSDGRPQTLTLPSGNTITYGYTDGKITSLILNGTTTILSNVLYQPFGPTRGWTWGNSTLAIREYDTDGKITDIDSAGLKTYSYDDAFRITGITDAANSSLSQSYGYDLQDRLTSATGTSLNQAWTYDANGNRLTQTGSAASTFTVSATSNRLSSVSGALTRTYGYDNAGNTTSDGTTTFTYNDAGRMVSATKAGVTTSYALNALGERIKKTTSSSSTYFVYDESGQVIGEYDNSGNLVQETVWLDDIPVATLRPNGAGVNLFYVHTDHLNTPRRISRPSDNVVVWRWDSDPFGTTAANQDPDVDSTLFAYNLRFAGQYFDPETGLDYNIMRDYDAVVGRYVEADPMGLTGGPNLYGYVSGNPVVAIDQLGLYEGSKVPKCVELLNNIETRRRDWMKQKRDWERTIAVRYMHVEGSAGPVSSKDPRPGPSVGVKLDLYWREREILTVWNGHTITTLRNRTVRCEAQWTDECGEVQHAVTWHRYEDILGVHAYWGVPTEYKYDWEWGAFIGQMTIPPM